ncbi:MAG TPA: R3H domain-containing nucleic acid-binding protein [Thermoanaerobaculia bacterium]
MTQRFEGRNLEDALQEATQTLGVERWQLTYHVLLEKRGFLGGMKRVVIEADVNPDATDPAPAATKSVAEPARQVAAPAAPRDRGPRPRRNEGGRGGQGSRSRGSEDRSRGRGRGRGRGGELEFRSGDFETFVGDVPPQGEETEAAAAVREWCEQVVRLARLDLIVRTEETEEQIAVRLYGGDSRQLLDRHGELLDAIQVLANKALVGRRADKDIELDCEQFKERRSEELAQVARDAAEEVRAGSREMLLRAMSPIERRIVHLALQDDADVTTESRGDGFFKRVAVVRRQSPGSEAGGPQGS